jgi:chaperonin GroES
MAKKQKKPAPADKKEVKQIRIRLFDDRVLVKLVEVENKTPGGIIIPDTVRKDSKEGRVVAVGEGKRNEDGRYIPMRVAVGDRVKFGGYVDSEDKMRIDGEEYLLINESNIVAVLK